MTPAGIDRRRWPAGHTVSMTTEASKGGARSTATCGCGGFEYSVPFRDQAGRNRQDAAIEAHWVEIEKKNPDGPRVDGMGRPTV